MYELIVIGGGSGGIAAARRAALHGAKKILLVEKDKLGGTCVNLGCVPKKILFYASEFAQHFKDSLNYGWQSKDFNFNWRQLINNKDKEIARLNQVYDKLLKEFKIETIFGQAQFASHNTIYVEGKQFSAKKILIATGGKPSLPKIKGIEYSIISDDVFFLKNLPKHIVIIGGGYIAVEFAGIFNSLGCEVEMLIRGKSLLRHFDQELISLLQQQMLEKNIKLHFNTEAQSIHKLTDNRLRLDLGNENYIFSEMILNATGRMPNSGNLNLEKIGINQGKKGEILVNEWSETNIKNIFAVGDVTDRVNLTPIAINEGRAFADSEFGRNKRKISYKNIPTAVFSQPNIAAVGLTEEQAKEKFDKIDIYTANFRPLKNTISGNKERVFIKLIVESKSEKIVGIKMLGENAAELIQALAVGLQSGATKQDFDNTIAVHPTIAEEFVTMTKKTRVI